MTDLRQLPGYTLRRPPAQPAAPPAAPSDATAQAKGDALAVRGQIQASPLPERLAALYRRAASREIADKEGRRLPGLTDYEAAAMLGVERTTVNAARNALVDEGRVGKLLKRRCRYRPSNQDVWSWALTSVVEDHARGPR